MGHGVDLVPGDLLGEEPAGARGAHDLGQRTGVAEAVRQPDLFGLDAEVLQEEALAGDELTGHRLPARHVRVRLDPHAADGDELAAVHGGGDPGEQLGVVLLHPGVLLGRGAGEAEVRVGLGQLQDVGEGAGALADGLAHRPQPGAVDVGVADGDDPVRASRRGSAEHVGQLGAGVGGRAGEVVGVGGVHGPLQGGQDLGAAAGRERQLGHQAAQGEQVGLQLARGHVPQHELEPAEPVDRLRPSGGQVTLRGRPEPGVRHVGVGGALQVEVHRLAGSDREVGVVRGDRLDRPPVRGPGQALGLEAGTGAEPEVDGDLGDRARDVGPAGGDLAGDVDPQGAPGPTPRGPDLERLELLLHGLGERHRLARHRPGRQCQRGPVPVRRGSEVVGGEAAQAALEEGPVVVHESSFGIDVIGRCHPRPGALGPDRRGGTVGRRVSRRPRGCRRGR